MEDGSIPGQSFKRASQRIGNETWPYKNGRISAGIPERAGSKRVCGGNSNSNGTEVGKGR